MKDNFLRVPYGSTVHGQEEIDAVVNVLKTSTQMGKNVENFESEIAGIFDKKFGIMTNSGSSALFLAIESMNLPEGSEVITPALTFGTTVSCLLKNRLIPSFVDVKPNTFCIDVNKIEEKITSNTVAIVAPDLLGNVCEWDLIKSIADKYNLVILLDSADTLGATLNGKPTGFYADHAITSFYGSHIINGAGNGGILLTSDEKIKDQSKLLRSWGRSSSLFTDSEDIRERFKVNLEGIQYDAKFVFEEAGYQLEPSEMSAAFALIQLEKLQDNMSSRIINFKQHNKFFKKYEDYFNLPEQNPNSHTCWLAYPLTVKKNNFFTRTDLQVFLEERNIQTRVIFTGNILRQPMMKNKNYIGDKDEFVVSDDVMTNGILLACHHGLNEEMIEHLYSSIDMFMEGILKR